MQQTYTLSPQTLAKTEVYVGAKALALFADEDFITAWNELYEQCDWATVFQSSAFVETWYNSFGNLYEPVIVKREENGQLTGLLTLARGVEKLGITAAGGWDAYYHTWLVTENDQDRFIRSALAAVRKRFPGQKVMFKYIPPNTPLSWLHTDAFWRRRYVIRPFKRPVMEFTNPEVQQLFRKKQFRECRNRLARLGELRYEQVKDLETFIAVIDELAVQYDFRKGATLNKLPFRSCPAKKDFLLGLFKQNLLHVTLLKIDEKIIASLVATEGKGQWLHGAGINTHSPEFGRHSPGYVIMTMLGQQLHGEGYFAFDLTPGGHAYKDRLATGHDQLYELTITDWQKAFAGRLFYDYLKKASMYGLSRAGINPKALRGQFERNISLAKEKVKLAKLNGLEVIREGGAKETVSHTFVLGALRVQPEPWLSLKQNNLADLLNYHVAGGKQTRWEFLEDAMRRLENGERAFTWEENGQLKACAWVRSQPEAGKAKQVLDATIPALASVLCSSYFHPDSKAGFPGFLAAVCKEVLPQAGDAGLYATVSDSDKPLQHTLQEIGFQKVS
ncbi:GNAT family N-acetyltransferase [Pontibacter mangrovi]|uniref:GNAT family N-acetyltransferase n=1 Tax=Pontibacter mangrovi TaxID=2589816 RepID=A0A501W6R6_9BACT|nr:GNAT family N-acetyltransferase [Pontibacter mangrovi]TPE42507.1 GNAT family N-acetyltransferase [Pontibacter mangrovi]